MYCIEHVVIIVKKGDQIKEAIEKSRELVERSNIALIGTIGNDNFPNIKAMINAKFNDLKEIWFSTNTSSRRVNQIKVNDKSCVYFVDFENWEGLMLVGRMEINRDLESRKMHFQVLKTIHINTTKTVLLVLSPVPSSMIPVLVPLDE